MTKFEYIKSRICDECDYQLGDDYQEQVDALTDICYSLIDYIDPAKDKAMIAHVQAVISTYGSYYIDSFDEE